MAVNRTELGIQFEERVQRLAHRWPITATPWAALSRFYQLPEDMAGLRVLDVCAGGSDLTAVLATQGADSRAIDINYDNIDYVNGAVSAHYINAFLEDGDKASGPDYLAAMEAIANQPHVQAFRRSFAQERFRYVAAPAHEIPFADDFFDLVLSHNGILGVTQEDPLVLEASVEEAIRVAKAGGQIQLGPMRNNSHTEVGRGIAEDLITNLSRRSDLRVGITDLTDYSGPKKRITIVKGKLQ